MSEGGDYADAETGGGYGDEVCMDAFLSLFPDMTALKVACADDYAVWGRTGAPPRRGSIVNISSVLGRVGNATSGPVSVQTQPILAMS